MLRLTLPEPHLRRIAVSIHNLNIFDVEIGRRTRCLTRIIEVAGDFGLPVDHDGMAGVFLEIHAESTALMGNQGAVMGQSQLMQPPIHTRLCQQVHRAALQHACADPAQHIVACLALQHHGIDTDAMQQLTKQKARRPPPDDDHLCFHASSLRASLQQLAQSGTVRIR